MRFCFIEGALQGFHWAISGLIGIAIYEFSDVGLAVIQLTVRGKNTLIQVEIATQRVLLRVQAAVVYGGIFGD